jgi:hypothetical protein
LPQSKKKEIIMSIRLAVPAVALAALVSGCASYGGDGPGYGYQGQDRWDATRHYHDGDYQERVMSQDDRVYRGSDGRYYCRRSDGSAGLIIGGVAGGVAGNVIAPRGSKTLGTLLGAAGGAVIGNAVASASTRCR